MSRRHGPTFGQIMRAANRAAAAADRANRAQLREMERRAREQLRAEKAAYLAAMQDLAEAQTASAEELVASLGHLLAAGMAGEPRVDFEALRRTFSVDLLDADLRDLDVPQEQRFRPKPPGFFTKLMPGWKERHHRDVLHGRQSYERALAEYHELAREAEEATKRLKAEIDEHNAAVDALHGGYKEGKPDACAMYFELALSGCAYPEDFTRELTTAYLPDSRQVLVEIEVPTLQAIIPEQLKFRYVRAQDEVVGTRWPEKNRQALYGSVVAQATLRTAWEIFAADVAESAAVVVVNTYVQAIDPGTGKPVRPCLISLRVTRDELSALDLSNVDAVACLRHLKAAVSRSPTELVPVRPILELNMADPRFVAEQDVLSQIDTRPNLMELSPGEFESLITNLFSAMGLNTKLTQPSRDGGVDCVAFDPRPVLGGKVVIQAKRYRHTVGVSAVRDLFGTMHNEGASKGILVTTSGYGKAAYEFANGKPVELITGRELLYLLKEHGGVDARIVVPDDWRDPVPDVAGAD